MISLKNEGDRARIRGIQPEMLFALMVAESVYRGMGSELVVTSVGELSNSRVKGSKHLSGYAVDLRVRDMDTPTREAVSWDIRQKLGSDYDVVLESNHIHIEFDPEP